MLLQPAGVCRCLQSLDARFHQLCACTHKKSDFCFSSILRRQKRRRHARKAKALTPDIDQHAVYILYDLEVRMRMVSLHPPLRILRPELQFQSAIYSYIYIHIFMHI